MAHRDRDVEMRDRRFLVGLLLAALAGAFVAINGYVTSQRLRGDSYYVSDEVWYVTSARNLLVKVFHYQPVYEKDGMRYATLVYQEIPEGLEGCLSRLGGGVARNNYTEESSLIWVYVPEENFTSLNCNASEVIGGFQYPDKENIHNYMNSEHPPLGKYLIALSMAVLGDYPTSWRIPSLIEGFLIVIMVYLIGYKLYGFIGGLISVAGAVSDPILRTMCHIAMLDVHLAFFTTMTLLFLVYGRKKLAYASGWLAFSVKFSGLFPIAAAYLYSRIYRREGALKALAKAAAFSLIFFALSSPLILSWGPEEWANRTLSSFSWHTTSRGEGPASSPPWGWLINYSPMALHVDPDVYAVTNVVTHLGSAIGALLLLPLLVRRDERYLPLLMFSAIFLGFTAVYAKGNRTLYSFYAVQQSSAAATGFAVLAIFLSDNFKWVKREWAALWGRFLRWGFTLPEELAWLEAFRSPSTLLGVMAPVVGLVLNLTRYTLPTSYVLSTIREFSGSPPLPYEEHVYHGTPLEAWLTYSVASVSGGELIYGLMVVLASLIIVKELEGEVKVLHLTLFLVFLAPLGWTTLALAFVLRALNLKERPGMAAFLLGLGVALNPVAAFFLMNWRPSSRRDVAFLVAGFMNPLNLYYLALYPREWVRGLAWFLEAPPTTGLTGLMGLDPLMSLVVTMMAVSVFTYLGNFRAEAALSAFLLFFHASPVEWWVLLMPSFRALHLTLASDLLVGLAAASWVRPYLLVKELFKCEPTELAPCSLPALSLILVAFISLYESLREGGASRPTAKILTEVEREGDHVQEAHTPGLGHSSGAGVTGTDGRAEEGGSGGGHDTGWDKHPGPDGGQGELAQGDTVRQAPRRSSSPEQGRG